jgi:hypothetical protein
MDSKLLEYNLPINAYATFDAVSLKELIKERLTQNSLFTDQNFEGSNLAAMADIFAFAYHILLFYYNQTASEAMFDQAELYENMNKIVKAIGYKPSGPRSSVLSFQAAAASSLPIGSYTIKRYTKIGVREATFSFTKDVSFDKTLAGFENLDTLSNNALLHQGSYFEYPDYTAIGEDYEVIPIVLQAPIRENGSTNVMTFIDYDNIDVYIFDTQTQTWSQWEEVDSLYFNKSTDKVFEKRVNENGRYEIKFGNNINGRRLNSGDIVSIFYLKSTGRTVGRRALDTGAVFTLYNTQRFRDLTPTLYSDNNTSFITPINSSSISLSNPNESTPIVDYETVDSIKQNAPLVFNAQNRAVTISDYKSMVDANFNNILQSVEVVNNDKYISDYIKYFYDIGLSSPNEDNSVLLSRALFSDSCDFNNIYIFSVPKVGAIFDETEPVSMATSQKQVIIDYLEKYKMVSNNVVVVDPIYTAFDIGVETALTKDLSIEEIRANTTLEVKIDTTSRLAKSKIRDLINNIFINYFSQINCSLGQYINLSVITRDILNIETVTEVSTKSVINNQTYSVPGISMAYWNPIYPQDDLGVTNQIIKLPFYKFPFLYEASQFVRKINIID